MDDPLSGVARGSIARAIQVFESDIEGPSRARLLAVIAANPAWWTENREMGTRIWARGRLLMYGLRNPALLDAWWVLLEMALGARSKPDLRRK